MTGPLWPTEHRSDVDIHRQGSEHPHCCPHTAAFCSHTSPGTSPQYGGPSRGRRKRNKKHVTHSALSATCGWLPPRMPADARFRLGRDMVASCLLCGGNPSHREDTWAPLRVCSHVPCFVYQACFLRKIGFAVHTSLNISTARRVRTRTITRPVSKGLLATSTSAQPGCLLLRLLITFLRGQIGTGQLIKSCLRSRVKH